MLRDRLERSQMEGLLVSVGMVLILAAIALPDGTPKLVAAVVGAIFTWTALALTFWPEDSEPNSDEDYSNVAEDGKISVSQAEPPLREFFPDEIAEAEKIDWNALCREIERSRHQYVLPTAPGGEEGPWLDKLAICQDTARFVRDGGSIDVDRVIES